MYDVTQNLLSTYYGFGTQINVAKILSVHNSINDLTDDTNISLADESLENEDQTSTKESSKEEDTIEHYEDGFSTLDEEPTIFDDEDLLTEYVDILEPLCDEKNSENLEIETDDHSQEDNFEKLNKKNLEIENSIDKTFFNEKINEDEKLVENLSSCTKFPSKKHPSCDGIFFDFNGAGISCFPEDMFLQFPNLKMVYLEGNNLSQLPGELFTSLKFLQWLDLRNNQMNSLPSTIKGHPNLETILIQRNKIERLPLELGTLPKLKRLQISHNPLIYPSKKIVFLGSTEVLRYLREEWNKIHPEESVEPSKEELFPKSSIILCYQPKTKKKTFQITKKGSTGSKKLPERTLVRKKTWNYKPSNRCDSYGSDESLETRFLSIKKAKEFLEERASELQKLIDKSTLKNWRLDRSSFNKSMMKAANRTEEDIPFAVDPNSISVSMRQNQKKSTTKLFAQRKRSLEEPIIDINKNIDQIFESLEKLKSTEITESMTPKTEKKMLETEMQKIIDLQNSIKRLQKHNDMITAPYEGKELNKNSYDFLPSIII